jgi:uncharacterized membrane protein
VLRREDVAVDQFKQWMWVVTLVFEVAGVVVIVGGLVIGSWRGALLLWRRDVCGAYDALRAGLGRGVLLGIEILVAADLIRTVVVELTLANVAVLAALVGIRTFLSWTLEVEIEGQWPWQKKSAARERRATAG